MDREEIIEGQSEVTGVPPAEEAAVEVEASEVAARGQHLLKLSRELNSSSKALLEQIDPIA